MGKLAVYTAPAGIDPNRSLPVMLDVGTDRQSLLDDPLYIGNRHPRVPAAEYDAFLEAFVAAVGKVFPGALLHWEDMGIGQCTAAARPGTATSCPASTTTSRAPARSTWPPCWPRSRPPASSWPTTAS